MYIFQKHRAEKPHTGIPFPLHLHAAFGKSLISLCLSIHPNIKSTALYWVPQNSLLNRALQSVKPFVSQYYKNVSEENFCKAFRQFANLEYAEVIKKKKQQKDYILLDITIIWIKTHKRIANSRSETQ